MAFSTSARPDRPAPADRQDGADATLAAARARDVDRREQCVAAARDLASETASAAFTVAQIAARAGVSLKAFYRCFPGKDELLLALIEDDSRIGARALATLVGERENPVDALHACVTELFALVSESGQLGYASVLVREHRRLWEHYPRELSIALAPLVDLLAAHVAAATNGPDPQRDADTMFRLILQGIDEVVVGRVVDPRELAEYLWQFCWRGLSAASEEG